MVVAIKKNLNKRIGNDRGMKMREGHNRATSGAKEEVERTRDKPS